MKAIFLQNCESWDERNCPNEDLRSLYEKKMSKYCFHIYVSGKVQGVWFRASTQEKARELKLTG